MSANHLAIGARVQVRDRRDGALAIPAGTVVAWQDGGCVVVRADDGFTVGVPPRCVEPLGEALPPDRAEAVARALFPDDVAAGDCRNESGRKGQPCSICEARNRNWRLTVERVRRALEAAP